MADKDTSWVSTRELQSELRSLRWEMRFLIAAAGAANIGLAKVFNVPDKVVGFIHYIF